LLESLEALPSAAKMSSFASAEGFADLRRTLAKRAGPLVSAKITRPVTVPPGTGGVDSLLAWSGVPRMTWLEAESVRKRSRVDGNAIEYARMMRPVYGRQKAVCDKLAGPL